MTHRPRNLLLSLAIAALPATPTRADTASWLSPTSGSWSDGSKWSTGAPPGTAINTLISATGSPYTVTANYQIAPTRLDLTSSDATLDLPFGASDTTLNLAAGNAVLRAGLLRTTVTGPAGLTLNTADSTLLNLTLATDLRGAGTINNNVTEIYGTLTLNNGTLHLSNSLRPEFYNAVNVTGTGTIVSDQGGCFAYLSGSNSTNPRTLTLGPDITLKTAPGGGILSIEGSTNNPTILNYGTISAEAPNTSIVIGSSIVNGTSYCSVINAGLLSASNSGSLSVALPVGGSPGNMALSTGGSISLSGNGYSLNQPFTIPATTRLQLGGAWSNSSTLSVSTGGTLTIATNPTSPGAISYAPASTVQLTSTLSAPALATLNTTPSTNIQLAGRLDLANSPFSFTSIPGQWSFPAPAVGQPGNVTFISAKATIQNGTLSDAPAGNDLLPAGGALNLSAVTVNFPLTIDDGILIAQSSTTFAQPVTLTGGRLILQSFSNPGGISASAGTLELPTLPASPGNISLSGTSTLQLNFPTTFAAASSLPFGTPGTLAIGSRGILDCQSASIDLSTLPYTLALTGDAGPANLSKATLSDPTGNHPLRVSVPLPGGTTYSNRLSDVTCSADITLEPSTTLTLFRSTLVGSHVTGNGTLDIAPASTANPVTLDNVALEGTLRARNNTPLTILNHLTLNGPLTIDPTYNIDLTTATLEWTPPSPSTALTTLRTYLSDSRLRSTSADATHRLGYLPLSAGAQLRVLLTLTGDANLDGKLDADDYTLLDRGYAVGGSTWPEGDFNYDGIINNQDYLLLDATYAQQQGGPPSPALLSQRESQFGPDYVSSLLTSIPEPSSLLVPLAACLPVLPRRRRAIARTPLR